MMLWKKYWKRMKKQEEMHIKMRNSNRVKVHVYVYGFSVSVGVWEEVWLLAHGGSSIN